MPFEIVKPDTHIDFIGKRHLAGALSALLLLASVIAIPLRGIQVGIDFAGGTEIQVRFEPGVQADEGRIREVVGGLDGIDGLDVVRYGEAGAERQEFLLKFQSTAVEAPVEAAEDAALVEGDAEAAAEVEEAAEAESDIVVQISQTLGGAIGAHSLERVEFVGPRVGAELRDDGLKALLFASLVILGYIAFRFSSRFAPGAIVAVLHDLLITAGLFVILGLEFDLRILAAMLAILGYSLNDTIIIYDRIRENMAIRTKFDLPEVLNQSVNQTLSRTVLTSGTTLAALLSLFFLGGEVIRPFAFAMTIGVLIGTYSSVFIAAPTLLFLETRWGGAK
ncbi:MAG: protein translocase subunit SecF [Myxococcota bacterium]